LDADALNLLSSDPQHRDDWILTPHPGEACRLLGVACQEIQEDRYLTVSALQEQYGGTVLLKGAGTLIKGPYPITRVCRAGNPGMASGGMGDILSGVIGGLVAQNLSLQDAAEVGVFVHGIAGDRAAAEGGERGLLASDVLGHLRHLVNPQSLWE
jgi:NAD(P)H-hydrate epimerase